ncbi:MAG: hypothetical protein MRZ79_18385 [Bacteroidia bacterium]|nr:hypothetical protein [Bacteroidia bacterium]
MAKRSVLFGGMLFFLITLSCVESGFSQELDFFVSPFPDYKERGITLQSPVQDINLLDNPEKNQWVLPLEGTWDFCWVENAKNYLSPDEISRLKWDAIGLPSNWQIVPKYDNPVFGKEQGNRGGSSLGVYRKSFILPESWRGGETYLRIEGGGSEFQILINGKLIKTINSGGMGLSVALTPFLKPGANELNIQLPFKSSSNSQIPFHWQFAGLDKKVYLSCHKTALIDQLYFNGNVKGAFDLKCRIKSLNGRLPKGSQLQLKFTDKQNNVIFSKAEKLRANHSENLIEISNKLPYVYPWSAESPNEYTLELSLVDNRNRIYSYTVKKVAFRTSTFSEQGLTVNDKTQKIKAVWYRTFHPAKGYAMTKDDYKTDLSMMKAKHINAIYLKKLASPELYKLCQEMGIYVISDLREVRSKALQKRRLDWEQQFPAIILNIFSSSPSFSKKNTANTSFEGFTNDSYFFDPTFTLGDAREQLASLKEIKAVNVLGAWADQALIDPAGKEEGKLSYQGNSRSKGWKYPQVMDGMVDANRNPQPELELLKDYYAPVQLSCFKDYLVLKHDFEFRNLSTIELLWKYKSDKGIREFKSKLPPYFPNFLYKIKYPFESVGENECLEVWAVSEKDNSHIFGQGNFCTLSPPAQASSKLNQEIRILESITNLDIMTPSFSLSFDKGVNMLESMRIGKNEILSSPPIFRLAQNSDLNEKLSLIMKNTVKNSGMEECQVFLDEVDVRKKSREAIEIIYEGKLFSKNELSHQFVVSYTVSSSSEIEVNITVKSLKDQAMDVEQVWNFELARGFINWKTPYSTPKSNYISNFQYPFLIPLYPQRTANASWLEVSPLDEAWSLVFHSEKLPPFAITHVELEDWHAAEHRSLLKNSRNSYLSLGPLKSSERSSSISYKLLINTGN